eukprot:6079514-Amphidinium_carterae.1
MQVLLWFAANCHCMGLPAFGVGTHKGLHPQVHRHCTAEAHSPLGSLPKDSHSAAHREEKKHGN